MEEKTPSRAHEVRVFTLDGVFYEIYKNWFGWWFGLGFDFKKKVLKKKVFLF